MDDGNRIVLMGSALRSARRILRDERKVMWESFTIPPDRSFNHMNSTERRDVRRFDRAIEKIEAALRAARS